MTPPFQHFSFQRFSVCLVSVLAFQLSAFAQNLEVNAVITVTANPATGNSLVINGDTRLWTNNPSANPAIFIATTNSTASARTNLLVHLTANVAPGPMVATYNATNTLAINLRAPSGSNLVVNIGGGWATVSYFTNTYAVAVPILSSTNAMSAQARSNAANALVNLLNLSTTNVILAGSRWLTNYADLFNPQILGNKTLSNGVFQGVLTNITSLVLTQGWLRGVGLSNSWNIGGTNSGVVVALTNGVWTNATLLTPRFTNAVNYGRPFSSPGTNDLSEQFGANAHADGVGATALGESAGAAGDFSTSLGNGASAAAEGSTAVGYSAGATGYRAVGLGAFSSASASNAMSLGAGAIASFADSMAIGRSASSTAARQIKIGANTNYTVEIGGVLSVGTSALLTNAVLSGGVATNQLNLGGTFSNLTTAIRSVNTVNGDLAFPRVDISTLANGHNTLAVGTNVNLYLTGSPSGDWQLGGLTGGARDGRVITIYNALSLTGTILNESGTEPTPANRIVTGDNNFVATIAFPPLASATFRYNATSSRWELIDLFSPARQRRMLSVIMTPVNNSGASETIFNTLTVKGGLLSVDGDALIVRASGAAPANGASKRLRLALGGQTLYDSGSAPMTNGWVLTAEILRSAAGSAVANTLFSTLAAPNTLTNAALWTQSITWGSNNGLQLFGTGAATGDLTNTTFSVEYRPGL